LGLFDQDVADPTHEDNDRPPWKPSPDMDDEVVDPFNPENAPEVGR
jgi:hypothetical protein